MYNQAFRRNDEIHNSVTKEFNENFDSLKFS